MTIPAEVFVWMIGAVFAVASFAVHLLIRINGKVGTIATSNEVSGVRRDAEIASLRRHIHRNSEECRWMKDYLAGRGVKP